MSSAAQPAAPATGTAGDLFHQLFSQLAGDVAANGKGLLTTFFNNVIANPTTQNVVAQGAILAASAPMQLPNLEQEAVTQIAKVGLALTAMLQPPAA